MIVLDKNPSLYHIVGGVCASQQKHSDDLESRNMRRPAEPHRSPEELEDYSLGRLDAPQTAALEEHLLICPECTRKLVGIEPYNFVHYTPEGPFYSRITSLRNGAFFARHWGRNLQGGKEFQTRAGARAYLTRSFSQMFRGHVCSSRCGSTAPGRQVRKTAHR
jgi:hypothetical protein